MTPQSLLRWFAPPQLSRPDLQRSARALWIVSWPFFAVVTVMLGIAVLVEPDTLVRRATTVASVGAVMILLHTTSRAGRPALASWILVIGLSVIVTQRAWITGGINAPVAVFYVLFIVMAGILIGTRGGIATAAVCFLGAIILTVGTARLWLTPRPGAGSPLGGFVFVVFAIALALVIQALLTYRPRHEGLGVNAVQMLVHDMRTPMQVLLAHLELLKYDISGEAAQDVEAAIDGATTLSRMTTSLLDVSRLEAGRMPLQRLRTDLFVLAHSVVRSIRILQPTLDVAVEARGDSVCICDPELTRRIIENLVSNSMKHTRTDGQVRVIISGSTDKVQIAVHDDGPGIPRAKRSGIFDLYSADGLLSTTGSESSGIGLAFCRLAAEAQDGTIRIEGDGTDGSLFVVELPR